MSSVTLSMQQTEDLNQALADVMDHVITQYEVVNLNLTMRLDERTTVHISSQGHSPDVTVTVTDPPTEGQDSR